jgi:carboxyl-terminal processing protease
MGRTIRVAVFSLSVLVLLYVSLGYVFGQSTSDPAYNSLTVYSEVLDHVQQDYVDQPDLHVVTVGALHGLLEALDPESSYLSPQEYAELKKESDEHAPGSVGLSLSKRGYIYVVAVLPDSPAQKSAIHEGDVLESIAGYTTQDMSIQQAQLLLRGAPGSTVKVSLIRRGSPKPQETELTRAVVPRPQLLTSRLEGDIAYLHVVSFPKGTTQEVRGKLEQFKKQGAQKLVLDLRSNASGEDSEAIHTAELFLKSGTIAALRGQTITDKTFTADPAKVVWSGPMTVLISGSTSGPAEILAAAIADNHRGQTVGQDTQGMASEQKLLPLQDGSALLLTVGIYYTPADKAILNAGLTPDVRVPPPNSQLALLNGQDVAPDPVPGQLPAPGDLVVKKAVEILQAGAGTTSTAEEEDSSAPVARHSARIGSGV